MKLCFCCSKREVRHILVDSSSAEVYECLRILWLTHRLLSVSAPVYPKTLMSQTRLAIRRYLPLAHMELAIDSLDLPLILKNYLKHNTSELL